MCNEIALLLPVATAISLSASQNASSRDTPVRRPEIMMVLFRPVRVEDRIFRDCCCSGPPGRWIAICHSDTEAIDLNRARILARSIGGPDGCFAFVMLADQLPLTALGSEGHRRPLGDPLGIRISRQRAPAAHRQAIIQCLRLAGADRFGRGASQILCQASGCLQH